MVTNKSCNFSISSLEIFSHLFCENVQSIILPSRWSLPRICSIFTFLFFFLWIFIHQKVLRHISQHLDSLLVLNLIWFIFICVIQVITSLISTIFLKHLISECISHFSKSLLLCYITKILIICFVKLSKNLLLS